MTFQPAIDEPAVFQLVFAEDTGHHGQVLPFALGVGESQVDPLDVLFLDLFQNVAGS